MKNNTYTVAVLGAGNIGSAVISRLLNLDNEVINIEISKILISDTGKNRDFDKNLFTKDFNDILNDENIDLVIEVLGGVDPGKEYIKSFDLPKKDRFKIVGNLRPME